MNISDMNKALVAAAAAGDAEEIARLVEEGADVNFNEDVSTLVSGAHYAGFIVIEDLFPPGGAGTKKGLTPLMLASAGGHVRAVETLLAKKAEVDLQDGRGLTALFHAVKKNNPVIAGKLLGAGADPDIPNAWGATPLMQSVFSVDAEYLIDMLISGGADASRKTHQGYDALQIAETVRLSDAAAFLKERLEKGVSFDPDRGAPVNLRRLPSVRFKPRLS